MESRLTVTERGQLCAIPGCDRPTSRTAGTGRADYHCRYHVQHKARHGSHWHPTYRADELKPYIRAAESWFAANAKHPIARASPGSLQWLLAGSGQVDAAMNLRGRSAAYRARVAFARLREDGVKTERLLAIHLGVTALIEDDFGSHRETEFRIVQIAKAVHRLASGTHRTWEMWNPGGSPVPIQIHAYPRSSGIVLRRIGEAMEKSCEPLCSVAVPQIIELKTARYGLHSSHLPGWKPAWDKRAVRTK